MTYAVTLTPERTSYKLMHLRWSISDPSVPVLRGEPQVLHDEHPDVVRQNLLQVGLTADVVEQILYTGATVELTREQIVTVGISMDRAEVGYGDAPLDS